MSLRSILTGLVIVLSLQAFSQTKQGTLLIAGKSDLSFVSQNFSKADTSSIQKVSRVSAGVDAGYFLMDGVAVGISTQFALDKQDVNKSTTTSLGVFGRYYLGGAFYGSLNASYIKTKVTEGLTAEATGFSGGAEIGYSAFVLERLAIEPSAHYKMFFGDFKDVTGFGLNLGLTFFIYK